MALDQRFAELRFGDQALRDQQLAELKRGLLPQRIRTEVARPHG
jgi:hypothetical protein